MKNFWLLISTVFLFGAVTAPVTAEALVSFGAPEAINSTAATDSLDDNGDSDESAATAAGDSGTWVTVWASNDDLGGTVGTDFDILFARSSDGGQTWTAPAALTADAAGDGGFSDSQPAIAYGEAGAWIVAWTSTNDLGGTVDTDGDIFYSVSVDDGETWSAAAALNIDAASDDSVSSSDILPTITAGSGTEWIVAWNKNEGSAGSQFFSSSSDNGLNWVGMTALGTGGDSDGQGIEVAYTGTEYVAVWSTTNTLGATLGGDTDILSASIATGTFAVGSLTVVNSGAAGDGSSDSDRFPAVVASGSDLIAAWEHRVGISGDLDIFSAVSDDSGATWAAAVAVNSNGVGDVGDDERVDMAFDGTTAVAVWSSNDEVGNTIKTDDDILVAYSTDSGASWSSVTHLASTAVKDKGGDEQPAVATDNAGTWLVAFESKESLSKTIGTDSDILGIRASQDCPSTPFTGCFEPALPKKGFFLIKEKPKKDLFKWKFSKGPEVLSVDLGTPASTDDYFLCAWDQDSDIDELLIELDMPAGGTCFDNDCWASTSTGFLYKHKFGVVGALDIKAGEAGKSKALVKSGFGFKAPLLPLLGDSTVTIQLRNRSNGSCWSTEFSTLTEKGSDLVKGKSD